MQTYKKTLDFIESLNLQSGQTYRGTCPVCSRKNTFTVEVNMGKVVWNCYSASCSAKGAKDVGYTRADIGKILQEKRQAMSTSPERDTTFSMPPYFAQYENDGWAKEWLAKHNVYLDGRDPLHKYLRIDVRNNRLVFLCRDPYKNEWVDAVGRSNTDKPKWLRYGESGRGFFYYHHSYLVPQVIIVVEDALSAVCISRAVKGVVGYALMGTSMSDEQRTFLSKNGLPIIICLDRDAQDKALKMKRNMPSGNTTMVYMPTDDLKYGHEEDIANLTKLINNC